MKAFDKSLFFLITGVLLLLCGVVLISAQAVKTTTGEIIFDQFDCMIIGSLLIILSISLLFLSMRLFRKNEEVK